MKKLAGLVFLLFAMFAVGASAQSPTLMREYLQLPWLSYTATAPDNTLTSATNVLTYGSSQPTAGTELTISGAYYPTETYEIYANGGTYTGDNHGIEIEGNVDDTYTTFTAVLNANSNFVTAAQTAGSNLMTLTAKGSNFSGANGNYIVLAGDIDNITTVTSLSGGLTPDPGRQGSTKAVYNSTTDTFDLYIRSSGTHRVANPWDKITRVVPFTFFDVDVAASQSAAAWGVDTADVGGAFKEIPVAFAGSVLGIAVYSNAATTTGTLTADATINGTATGLQAGLNSVDDTQSSHTLQVDTADAVTAGQRIGVKVTTSASPAFAPTTADAVVTVWMGY